jgi:hypothetical protein
MMKVDFMIIGAQKAGTTSLAAQLSEHPGICFSRVKEPGYFNNAEDWEAGLDGYHQLYVPEDGQICGEASTMYTSLPQWEHTHSRLYAYNPALKLIYIMRQPVERVISNYSHRLVRGLVKAPPEVAIFDDPVYINRSRYKVQITPYLELFGREKVLLLVFEEYAADQRRTLQAIAEFLGVSSEGFKGATTAQRHRSVGDWYWRHRTVRELVRSDAIQTLRSIVPISIRKAVRRKLSNRLDEKPHFSLKLRREIWRLVKDDVHGIEELMGSRLDVWRANGAGEANWTM